jgi:hypothetical protein
MVLREKLKSIKMTKAENVVTYLTRLTQVRDELRAMGEAIVHSDLVRTALNGVSKQWVVFVEGIVASVLKTVEPEPEPAGLTSLMVDQFKPANKPNRSTGL